LIVAAVLACSLEAFALECPAMPQQSQRDTDMAVAVAVSRISQMSGPQLQAQTRTVTTDLLRQLPRADRVYLEQMMYATYCSSLRDNPALTEAERNTRIQAYNRELRATLHGGGGAPAAKMDPRDAARADLARIPVEYTPEAFVRSARDGKTNVVRLFLQAGIDPSGAVRDGATALMQVAGRGDVTLVEMLLKAGAAIDARDRDGSTALVWAAAGGHVPAMRVLLKAGASQKSYNAALLAAVRWNHVDALRLMLEQGANPRADDGAIAARLRSLPHMDPGNAQLGEVLNILLQRGWPVDARSGHQRHGNDLTALMIAASNGDMALMQLLLKAGADVNLQCDCRAFYSGGHTALTLACQRGDIDAVQLLLDAGAVLEAQSRDGTPLMVAVEHDRVAVLKLLLEKGADPNKARNDKGETALMHAAYQNIETVKLLLAAGADVNAKGKAGGTALMWAAERDRTVIARMLLDAGADIESKSQRGRTALIVAAITGSVDTARLLIQRGARIDVLDEDNRSAAAHASEGLKGEARARMLSLLGQKESK
jgi:ankyrin repeat protein